VPVTYTDNFNRSNASPLDGNWDYVDNGGSWPAISSNQVINNNGTWGAYAFRTESYSDNQYSQIQYTYGSSPSDSGGPMVRARYSASNYTNGYMLTIYPAYCRFYKFTGADADGAQIGSDIASTWTTNDVAGLAVIGTTLYALKNGRIIGTVTDSTYTSGGAPGFAIFGSNTFDNWSGGDPYEDNALRFVISLRTDGVG
jgi:hypothetical protein